LPLALTRLWRMEKSIRAYGKIHTPSWSKWIRHIYSTRVDYEKNLGREKLIPWRVTPATPLRILSLVLSNEPEHD